MSDESGSNTKCGNAYTTTARPSRAHTPTASCLVSIGDGKTQETLDVASFDHRDISAEVGMFNKKLKFKVLVRHRSGAVAALEGPKDVTEHMVRFVCDMLETWGVCVLKCQKNEPAEIALQNAVVRTRQFKTIPRNTPRYSHGSLGHCESAIKEVEKHIRATLFQKYADCNCNSDKFPAELQIFPGWWDMLRGHTHGMRAS